MDNKLNLPWLSSLFPGKETTKIEQWLLILGANEFDRVSDLSALDSAGWESLPLPLAVKAVLKKSVVQDKEVLPQEHTFGAVSSQTVTEQRPPSQVDCIVVDISGSMKARSKIDVDKTREDVSKMLFHTLVDKLISLELSHAVGLLAFGETVIPIGITTQYERFHDELGRLDANQGKTKLYDSIKSAAQMISDFVAAQGATEVPILKRVFVLTDGEDNASKEMPWQVAQYLQERSIVLDAIPLADPNRVLRSMCTATGGLCFEVVSQDQGMVLFEREATLHLPFREAPSSVAPRIVDASSLIGLEGDRSAPVKEIRSAIPKSVFSPVMTARAVEAALLAADADPLPVSGDPKGSGSIFPSSLPSTAPSRPAVISSSRRIMREFVQISSTPVDGWNVFMSADDCSSWKGVLSGLPAPYIGGNWLVTFDFSSTYPMRPPRVRFVTPMYHCNVSVDGAVCLDVLQEAWSPAITMYSLLSAIRELILKPDAASPLDATKGALYRDFVNDGKPGYHEEASRHTAQFAGEPFDCLAAKYNLLS